MPSPLEQQPRESAKAFAAFKAYLELGPERSLAAVAKKLGKSKSNIATWSRKHHWQDRLASSQAAAHPINTGLQPGEQAPAAPPAVSTASALSTINHQPSTPPHPWEQQPGETDRSFLAFTAYLALGPGRSLGKASQATHRTKDQLAHWSTRWRWRARALAYHAHLSAIERKATEALVAAKSHDWLAMHEQVRRQAWAEAEDLIALAQDFKARWRDSDRLPDFGALIRALDLAFKLKQFAAGMPSEIKEVTTTLTGPAGGPIRLELEAALNKIYGTPIPGEVVDVEAAPAAPQLPPEPGPIPPTT
ncbi:MAG TPA: hypothetical protein VHP11_12490 [Tepidisphaeraceae bacterium]|nr:hypothetical protein [Tepidisphaeraceae bacterium]